MSWLFLKVGYVKTNGSIFKAFFFGVCGDLISKLAEFDDVSMTLDGLLTWHHIHLSLKLSLTIVS